MSSIRSSLASARGLGSAKTGVSHWWFQRVSAVALVPPAAPAARSTLRMAGDAELVPVNEDSIKTSSAVTAGGAGFLVGGPVFGAITAAAGNYAAKQDSEVCSGVRTRSRV